MIRSSIIRSFSLVIIIAVIFPQEVYSERRVTLREAIEMAIKSNDQLRAAEMKVLAQKEEIGIARGRLLPKVYLEERVVRTNNPPTSFSLKLLQERFTTSDFAISSLNNPDPINDFQTYISIEQPLFSRKASIAVDISRDELKARDKEFLRKKEEVVFDVVKTYLLTRSAAEFVRVAKRSIDDAKEHKRIAELRFKQGLGLYSDTLRATTALTQAEQRLVSAKKNLEVLKRRLGILLGVSEAVDISVPDAESPAIPLKSMDYYIEESRKRSDLKAMELRYRNAENGISMAKAGYLPTIGVGASYQLNTHTNPFDPEGDSWQVMAFLRWDIFDGWMRRHKLSKARLKLEETEAYLNGLKKGIYIGVFEAYQSVKEAEKNLELARAALKTAEEGERLVRKRYSNSLSSFVDLLDAQMNLDRARADIVVKRNALDIAVARLAFESGTILNDLGIKGVSQGSGYLRYSQED